MPGRWQISLYPALTSLLHSKRSRASVEFCPAASLTWLLKAWCWAQRCDSALHPNSQSHSRCAAATSRHSCSAHPSAPALFPKPTWTAVPSFHSPTWNVLKWCSRVYFFLLLFFISQYLKCLILLFLSHISPVLGSFLLPFFYLTLLFSHFQSPLAYVVSLFCRLVSINVLILYFTLFLCLTSYFQHILYIYLYLPNLSFSIPFYYLIPSH